MSRDQAVAEAHLQMKVWILVDDAQGEPQRVCWYVGTSDLMIENAVRMLLHLPRSTRFLLRDGDGDLVPVSAALPPMQTYKLIVLDQGATPKRLASHADGARELRSSEAAVSSDSADNRSKRRRRQTNGGGLSASSSGVELSIVTTALSSDTSLINHQAPGAGSLPLQLLSPLTRPRSIANLVTRFLETFTRAIPTDDNINFIPNTGRYALYALYCELFADPSLHPKSQNAFYKMTSMQGKVDRQRVIRYYQHPAIATDDQGNELIADSGVSSRAKYVLYKPEGKGPLLRKFVQLSRDTTLAELLLAATFVSVLDLNPQDVVARYLGFVHGFLPVAKAEFQAHAKSEQLPIEP